MIVEETEMVGNFKIKIFQDEDPWSPRNWDNLGHMVCWNKDYNLGDETRKDSQEDWLQELAESVDDSVAERIYYWEDSNGYQKIFNDCAREFPDRNWMDRPTSDRVNEKVMAIIYKAVEEHYIMLPLGLYSHSGITMYVGAQAHTFDPGGWDSGQVGWIYVTKKNIREEYGWKVLTKKRIETIEGYLRNEVEAYDRFLTGGVYGYTITECGVCRHCGAKIEVNVDSCGGNYMDSDELLKDVVEEVKNYESELDCECSRYKQLLSALAVEKEMFNFVSEEGLAALAGRIDARMEKDMYERI